MSDNEEWPDDNEEAEGWGDENECSGGDTGSVNPMVAVENAFYEGEGNLKDDPVSALQQLQ